MPNFSNSRPSKPVNAQADACRNGLGAMMKRQKIDKPTAPMVTVGCAPFSPLGWPAK